MKAPPCSVEYISILHREVLPLAPKPSMHLRPKLQLVMASSNSADLS